MSEPAEQSWPGYPTTDRRALAHLAGDQATAAAITMMVDGVITWM